MVENYEEAMHNKLNKMISMKMIESVKKINKIREENDK